MTFLHNEKPQPKDGDERTVTKFLLFPKRIGRHTKWLETVDIVQVYVGMNEYSHWRDVRFVPSAL